ncbi:MAG: hypothetical protein KBA75_08090 [Alphaproteobacteria bacterium]|nr:hypothetical protein [Alphaproteobacteria bacterium]
MNLLHLVEMIGVSNHQRISDEHRRRAADEILKRNILLWEREAAEEEGGMMEDVDGVTVHLRWRNPNLSPADKPNEPEPDIKSLSEAKPAPHAERPDLTVHHQHHSAHDGVLTIEDLSLNR